LSADPGTHRPSEAVERRDVQLLLRVGLWTATVLMTAGVMVALFSGRAPVVPLRVGQLVRGGLALSERLCGLGIIVLAATPAIRVVTLLELWIRERDWRFVAVALTVALVLLLAITLGHG
jgi:uncharacterized membrane protein